MSCTCDAEPGRGGAVDHHIGLQAAKLAVGGHVEHAGNAADSLLHPRHPQRQLLGIGIDQRELVLRATRTATDVGQLLRRPHVDAQARNTLQRLAHALDDGVGRYRRRARPAA